MKYENGKAEIILAYYAEGHTQAETMERFSITKNQLQYLAKRYKVSNGRIAADICRVNGQSGNERQKIEANERLTRKLNSMGLELISEYKGSEAPVLLRCRTCGAEFKRTPHYITRNKATQCPACKQNERDEQKAQQKAQAKAEADRKRKEKEEKRLIINPLGLSYYQLKRSAELDKKHLCRICGNTYTMRQYVESTGLKYKRVSGYCSTECRKKALRQREHLRRKHEGLNHYARARKHNAPREKGITLPKLIKRDGLQCAICGLMCIYGEDHNAPLYPTIDHIIAIVNGGGHTWDNVQVAHRQCNSYKGARTF